MTETKKPRKTVVKLNLIEINALFSKLKEVLDLPPGFEPFEGKHTPIPYIAGYSDDRVVQEMGGRINKNHVRVLRQNYFGPLHNRFPSAPESKGRFGDQIAELRNRVNRLEADLDELRSAIGGGL